MRNYTLYTATSCKSTKWTKAVLSFEDIAAWAEQPIITHETAAEYAEWHNSKDATKKGRASDAKDVGGFVGGMLQDGKRKKGSVVNRSLITLDLDNNNGKRAKSLSEISNVYKDYAHIIYTTHSATATDVRLRLILFLAYDVDCATYVNVSRRLAHMLGDDYFDCTTFQPERMMYYPSKSTDGFYQQIIHAGDEVEPNVEDEQHDVYISNEITRLRGDVVKAGTPASKPGIIGSVCRHKNVHDVIREELSGIYRPTDKRDVYDFVNGSIPGGVIIYDNGDYLYSFHATDPLGSRLLNAFDLVRLAKFSHKDRGAAEGTAMSELPSFKAASDYFLKDTSIAADFKATQLADLSACIALANSDDTGDTASPVTSDSVSWVSTLDLDGKGNMEKSPNNVIKILNNDSRFRSLVYNELRGVKMFRKAPKWATLGTEWRDEYTSKVMSIFRQDYKISNTVMINECLDNFSMEHIFNPAQAYIERCAKIYTPDVEALETLIIKYIGAEDTAYNRAVTRLHVCAMIKRVLSPGCEYHTALVLNGEQGGGKTRFCKFLGHKWYGSPPLDLSSTDAMSDLSGLILCEIEEMEAIKKGSFGEVKKFLSASEDRYRPKYGRSTITAPRRCVFVCTTNDTLMLQDMTGNRRFLPIDINAELRTDDLLTYVYSQNEDKDKEIEQLRGVIYSTAYKLVMAGEKLVLDTSLNADVKAAQAAHDAATEDPLLQEMKDYVSKPIPAGFEMWEQESKRSYYLGTSEASILDEYEPLQRWSAKSFLQEWLGLKVTDKAYTTAYRKVAMYMRKNAISTYQPRVYRDKFYGTQRGYELVKLDTSKYVSVEVDF